ncbi:MAG: acetyl-CoA hydrolase/transferase family protein [Dehalococcoidia bacterium]|nr:acetyl-CoA hydrolase/transferase family protein [Dehalococcoidia bacterium]
MRYVTAEEAVQVVEPGNRVYFHGGAATPHILIDALMARYAELRDVEIVHMHTDGEAPHVRPEMAGHFRHNALFIGANTRRAVQEGRADYTPIFLSEIPGLFKPGGALPLDVAIIQVTPPDGDGNCSLGVSVDCALAAAWNARCVVAQVNPNMPRTGGHSLPSSLIQYAVRVDAPLPEPEPPEMCEEFERIGHRVAELIDDGATLQMGIGGVPNAVLAQLGSHRDLGIHTEMFTDGVLPLVESGVINGARKTIHPGVMVSAFVIGSRKLYDFLDRNPRVQLRPVDYTNSVDVIAANHRMVAINSALAVDLTGQVVSDSIGSRFYSGIGGQVDFIRGAARSDGGVPVIALPATAKGGTISRITPEHIPGAGVVTTRGDVHWVVTEFGAVNLHGRTIRDRARQLISIADPRFQSQLEEAAANLGYLGRMD